MVGFGGIGNASDCSVAALTFLGRPLGRRGLIGSVADAETAKIQKSELTISEPRRHRDKAHLKFVASQPCLVCGRSPADAHHLRFTQPRAMGRKVSDEFTVPLCRTHHRDNHRFGDEQAWWNNLTIDAVGTSRQLWVSTRRIE